MFSQQAEEATPGRQADVTSAQRVRTFSWLLIQKVDQHDLDTTHPLIWQSMQGMYLYISVGGHMFVLCSVPSHQTDRWITTELLSQKLKASDTSRDAQGVRVPQCSLPACVCSAGVDDVFHFPVTTANDLHGPFVSTMKDFGRECCSHMSALRDVEAVSRAVTIWLHHLSSYC